MVLENGPKPDCLWVDNKKLVAPVHGMPLKWPGVQKRLTLHSLHRLNFIFSNQLHITINICKALGFICLFCNDTWDLKELELEIYQLQVLLGFASCGKLFESSMDL